MWTVFVTTQTTQHAQWPDCYPKAHLLLSHPTRLPVNRSGLRDSLSRVGRKGTLGKEKMLESSPHPETWVRPCCCGGTPVDQSSLWESDGALLFLQQEVVLTCSSGQWDRSVTCDPVDCRVPDQSHVYYAEFSCPTGTTYLQRCSFSCIPPAKLQGMVWSVETFNHPF